MMEVATKEIGKTIKEMGKDYLSVSLD